MLGHGLLANVPLGCNKLLVLAAVSCGVGCWPNITPLTIGMPCTKASMLRVATPLLGLAKCLAMYALLAMLGQTTIAHVARLPALAVSHLPTASLQCVPVGFCNAVCCATV